MHCPPFRLRPWHLYCACACLITQVPTASADQSTIQIGVEGTLEDPDECDGEDKPSYCKRGRFELRAAFDPDEQFIAGARAVNDHLFGSDHSLSLSAVISERRQEFRTDYDVPSLGGSELDFHSEAFTKHLASRHFKQYNTGVAMSFGRELSPHLSATLGYRLQEAETDRLAVVRNGDNVIHEEVNEAGIIAALELGLRFDNRNARRMGSTASLLVSQSDSRFGSDYQLTKLSADFTHRAPLVGPLSLSLRGYGETVWSRDGEAIPLAERLQWGGHSDVRGYGLYSTGPALGGDFKAGGQAELQFPLIPSWKLSAALFYDAGLVTDRDALGAAQVSLRQSIGVGLRWKSPIGPIGLDFARPIGDPDATPALLLSIGDSF